MRTKYLAVGSAFVLALTSGVLSACNSPTAEGAPAEASRSYSAGATEDTIRASALVIEFPDGNSLRFASPATDQVLVTASADETVSTLSFTSGGFVIVDAYQFSVDADNTGFFSTWPVAMPAITGDRSNGQAMGNLMTALSDMGMVVNLTVP